MSETTGAYSVLVHHCDGCRDYVEPPCVGSEDGKHGWKCFDHWGHPTGEQMCFNARTRTVEGSCSVLRHHPDQGHINDHQASHRAYLADGGACWCVEGVRGGDVTRDLWIEYANPTWPGEDDRAADAGAMATWYGIRETDTLQAAEGRESDDERHICPLQLGTIERCVRLWSNAGETVLTPFAGIGSEVYESVRLGRRAIGVELKASYFRAAVKNLRRLEEIQQARDLFSLLDDPVEAAS